VNSDLQSNIDELVVGLESSSDTKFEGFLNNILNDTYNICLV